MEKKKYICVSQVYIWPFFIYLFFKYMIFDEKEKKKIQIHIYPGIFDKSI